MTATPTAIRLLTLVLGTWGLAAATPGCAREDPGAGGGAAAVVTVPAAAAAAERLDPPAAPGAMAPHLGRAGDDLLLSWLEPTAAGHRLRVAQLTGAAWGEPVTVAEGGRFFANWADTPSVVGDGAGTLVAHWLEKRGTGTYAYGVRLARSTDGGASWSDLGLLHADDSPAEHGFASLVPAAGGSFEAVWLDGRGMMAGGPMALRWARLAAGGAAPEGEAPLDERVCDCCQTAAVATPEGLVVAYRDRTAAEVRDVAVTRRTAGVWSAPTAVAADGWTIAGCPVNGPALAADGRRLTVAWFTGAGDRARVQVALSADGGASFSAPAEVDSAAPLGRVGLVAAGDGTAVVSWLAADGTVRLRRVGPGPSLGPPATVGSAGTSRASGFPRLGLTGGDLVLAWVEAADGVPLRLRAARLPLAAVPAG